MANREISPTFLIVAGVVMLSVLLFLFWRASSPATPRAGSYTPGVPPWMEKNPTQAQQGVHQAPTAR